MTSRIVTRLVLAGAAVVVGFTIPAVAQQPAATQSTTAQPAAAFDGKKFFEELQSRGFKAPAGFDGKKYFEEVTTRGYNAQNKVDGKKFFEELQSRGFSVPAGFDGKKFLEEQTRTGGYNMPPMVEPGK